MVGSGSPKGQKQAPHAWVVALKPGYPHHRHFADEKMEHKSLS